ncbi:hypothetical protein G6O67_006492 [Ophiocordyceps sinensis]|uniref:RNase MRP protein 1 RNA binding domain-containing protein n=1 Tax=Ophiocordyceps sinensis TaxID=72228 RepID=A0A8H4LWW3_9HYPO|nr:hypothetical protein G6O67_006492 [Ophiocordyceps sinensis]
MKQQDPLRPSGPPTSSRAAADSLAVLLPILHAFNHRHRNQHRASHWWASFGLLRRALRRLADCLLLHAEATPPASAAALGRHSVAARARWLKSHVVPSAYVAFSQLAADNQHAPLGLLLLAILARTHAPTKPLQSPSAAEPSGADHGVVVSRGELLQPVSRPLQDAPKSVKEQARSSRSKAEKRGKNRDRDALSSLFNSLD